MEFFIRKATPDDATFIALCTLEALGYNLLGRTDLTNDETKRVNALSNVCQRHDTLYSHVNASIACDHDNNRVGCIIAYNGKDYHHTRNLTFSLLEDFIHFDTDTMEDETHEGEYYIDTLAVHPSFRRHSVGRSLLNNAILTAQDLSLIPVLACDPDNDHAYKLYTSVGLHPNGTMYIFGHTYIRMTP